MYESWIELSCDFVSAFGPGKVPIILKGDVAEKGVRVGNGVVQLDGFCLRRSAHRNELRRSRSEAEEPQVTITHAGIGQCIVWIDGDGLLKRSDTLIGAILGRQIHEEM